MMKQVIQTVINQLKLYSPEKIILFGSYAYGKPDKNSDLDIAVIKKTSDSFHERQKKARMIMKTTTPVDIFVFTPEEFAHGSKHNLLVKEIHKMGKVVYG